MNKIKIYTDGACSGNPGPGGWAFVTSEDSGVTVLGCGGHPKTTNNRMELKAFLQALKWIRTQSSLCGYEIVSDSAYVVNAITYKWLVAWKRNGWCSSNGNKIKNVDLWMKVHSVLHDLRLDEYKVTVIKVKGHDGNPLNEYADRIAKEEVVKQQRKIRKEEE